MFLKKNRVTKDLISSYFALKIPAMGQKLVEFYSSVGLGVEPELLTYSSLGPFEIGQHFSAANSRFLASPIG